MLVEKAKSRLEGMAGVKAQEYCSRWHSLVLGGNSGLLQRTYICPNIIKLFTLNRSCINKNMNPA